MDYLIKKRCCQFYIGGSHRIRSDLLPGRDLDLFCIQGGIGTLPPGMII